MSASYKVCPRCGSEFQPRLDTCLDCGAPLVEASAGEAPAAPPPPPDPPAPDGEALVPLREGELAFLEELAAHLGEAGVQHRLAVLGTARGGASRWAVLVRPEDVAAARAVDRDFYAAAVPGGDAAVHLESEDCPACGAPAGDAEECPECGLRFGGETSEAAAEEG